MKAQYKGGVKTPPFACEIGMLRAKFARLGGIRRGCCTFLLGAAAPEKYLDLLVRSLLSRFEHNGGIGNRFGGRIVLGIKSGRETEAI